MDVVSLFLVAIAAVILLGALGEVLFQRVGVPPSLWLILCGVLLGPVFGLVPRDDLAQLAPFIAVPSFITAVAELTPSLRVDIIAASVRRGAPLGAISFFASLIVVALTALVADLLDVLPDRWSYTTSILLAVTLAATCSLIVSPAMARLRLRPRLARTIETETTITNIVTIVLAALVIAALSPDAKGVGETAVEVLLQLSLGVGFALIAAALWLGFLHVLQAPAYAYPATLSAAMVLYVIASMAGGSGILATLVFTAVLANAAPISSLLRLKRQIEVHKDLRGFRRLLVYMTRSAFFLFLGLLLGPPWSLLVLGLVLSILLIAVRVPATLLVEKLNLLERQDRWIAAAASPRGMLTGSLAVLALMAHVDGAEAIPLTVFTVVALSIFAFSIALPVARSRHSDDDIVALEIDGDADSSPASLVRPDESSRRAMASSTDDGPLTRRSPLPSEAVGPLPPPRPPPRPKS